MFDLTQALVDATMTTFRITNFRPWLALGKRYPNVEECVTDKFRNLS